MCAGTTRERWASAHCEGLCAGSSRRRRNASCHVGLPSAPRIVHRTNVVGPMSRLSVRMSCRWGSAPAKLPRASSPVQTDNVAYSLRSGRASRAKPMTPSVTRSCLRTALAPRYKRQVERRLRGGMLDASTRYSRSRSGGVVHRHGDFTMLPSEASTVGWWSTSSTRCGWFRRYAVGCSPRTSACSTVVSGGELQDRLGEWCWVEAEGEVPLAWKAVELSSRQQFGYFVRSREH